jgi:hypothetical protein
MVAKSKEVLTGAPVASAPATSEKTETKPVRYRGMESRLHLARSAQNEWVYNVETGVPYEATLTPDYWAAFSQKFTPYDRIEVRCEDMSWIGWLRVIDAGLNWTKVVEERPVLVLGERPSDRLVSLDGHAIKYMGVVDKWVVIRDSDKAKLQAGLQSRDAAIIWLQGHLKAMAA